MSTNEFKLDLGQVLNDLSKMLVEKNTKYGDSALNPVQTFSKVDPIELINVRIDDKLSRIKNRQNNEDEDPEYDLLGYLILKRIALMRKKQAALSLEKDAYDPCKYIPQPPEGIKYRGGSSNV